MITRCTCNNCGGVFICKNKSHLCQPDDRRCECCTCYAKRMLNKLNITLTFVEDGYYIRPTFTFTRESNGYNSIVDCWILTKHEIKRFKEEILLDVL